MINNVYYYFALLTALTCVAAGAAVVWKNRYQAVGPLLGGALVLLGVWTFGFAHYYVPLDKPTAMFWAKVTLTAAVAFLPPYFHGTCALVERQRSMRWWILFCYAWVLIVLVALWQGRLVMGVREARFMAHYVQYNTFWYVPFVGAVIFWQSFASALLGYTAWRAVGYKRTQCSYILLVWFVAFVTINSILLPLEYDIDLPPIGLFALPFNFALVAYVMSRARLADFNVVLARVLAAVVALVVVVGVCVLFVGGLAVLAPGFMNQEQLLFSGVMAAVIGAGIMLAVPRVLPRAERLLQERLLGSRAGYQDALMGLVKKFGPLTSIEELLGGVVGTIHTQMQLAHAFILVLDPVSGRYRLQAQSGVNSSQVATLPELGEASAVVQRLIKTRDALVRDELARIVDQSTLRGLSRELAALHTVVAVPILLDDRLTGILCLGEKISREMFFVGDLRLLENVAAEVGLAVKYRHMEEEVSRKNRLVELGTIAAGVAHEIRNPLASIRAFAQLLPERGQDVEFQAEFSKVVQSDVQRIIRVVETMLAFARPAQVTLGEHSVTDLIEDAVVLVQARLRSKQIDLVREFHEQPRVHVDKNQILQVLVNLLNNAVDVLPEHGQIRIATAIRRQEPLESDGGHGPLAVIEVADNGPGIPASVRSQLFNPFFTTKKEGTGLGLSISQKIVRDHGGSITVSSIEGKGTSFQVNLPIGRPEPAQ